MYYTVHILYASRAVVLATTGYVGCNLFTGRCPRARSVNKLHPIKPVVTGLKPIRALKWVEFWWESGQICIMAKRFPLDAKDCPSPAKNRFNFNTDDDNFERYKQGFIAKNTADDTQNCSQFT